MPLTLTKVHVPLHEQLSCDGCNKTIATIYELHPKGDKFIDLEGLFLCYRCASKLPAQLNKAFNELAKLVLATGGEKTITLE